MFITKAYAQAVESLSELEGEIAALPEQQSATDLLLTNLMVLGVLVFLFYILLILPQQRRMKAHAEMLDTLKKGDKVITGGGLVGKVDKVIADSGEVVIDLGDGVKVTALRATIHEKDDPRLRQKKAANDKADQKKADDNKKDAKSAEKDTPKASKKSK